MTPAQHKRCFDNLWDRSPTDAVEFGRLMREADDLHAEASRLRREAWQLYHEHIEPGRQK